MNVSFKDQNNGSIYSTHQFKLCMNEYKIINSVLDNNAFFMVLE